MRRTGSPISRRYLIQAFHRIDEDKSSYFRETLCIGDDESSQEESDLESVSETETETETGSESDSESESKDTQCQTTS